jgi:TetR/AcrR family transcriptional regulator
MTRAEQRADTRRRIVDAAVAAVSDLGYGASSTRDIAARAGVTQGLVTYHFESKDALWRAAADRIFGQLVDEMPVRPAGGAAARRKGARDAIRSYVRFTARHPELLRFMVDAGRRDDERMRWLVETHLEPWFGAVAAFAGAAFRDGGSDLAPHVYYALVGAASLVFAVAPECQALTGLDALTDEAVERHADLMARLFLAGRAS